jgi:hypothetical protein
MIYPENNDRVIDKAMLFQHVEDLFRLPVNIAEKLYIGAQDRIPRNKEQERETAHNNRTVVIIE